MAIVKLAPEYFADPDRGKPLSNAYIYVGEPDLDPEILGNQKQISVQQEDGSVIIIAQPIRTGAGGVIEYLGSPVTLLVDGDYSLKVLDSDSNQVYYVPKSVEPEVPPEPEEASFYIDSGIVNAYVLTPVSPEIAPSAYYNGMPIIFRPLNDNTGESTVNVGAIGVAPLRLPNNSELHSGALQDIGYGIYNSVTGAFELVNYEAIPVDLSNYLDKTSAQAYTQQKTFTLATLTDDPLILWNGNTQGNAEVTIAGNRTLDNMVDFVAGAHYQLTVIQDATGGRTLAYDTNYEWEEGILPDFSSYTAGQYAILSFRAKANGVLSGVYRGPFG
jgi:hypothetical protein